MGRKNYLIEDLTEEEIKFIRGIIWNIARKCVRDRGVIDNVESESIYGENFNEGLFGVTDEYNFINTYLMEKYLNSKIELRPLTNKEQGEIVCLLDDIAYETDLYIYIKQLTFKEKLIVFLLYIKEMKINEITLLLQLSRYGVNYRVKSIEAKIKIMKGMIGYGI
ncbi:MAG: sigma-70 family RNA polymerase sigma factor [Clostridia bacterium]|nr:sigma-70 family RNA polymerase sigma factor [Clostridia bacterium]